MSVRAATAVDARAAARLHSSSITEGFLPRLGDRFLARLYRCIVADPRSFLLVAEAPDGSVAGMIAGSEDVHALYRRFLRRDGVIAAAGAAPRVIRNLRSVMETWRYGRAETQDLPTAELLAVAVDRAARGAGLGRDLVRALNDEFERRGTPSAKVVVGADNTAAVHLYRKCGYRDAMTVEVHQSIESKVMVWSPSPR